MKKLILFYQFAVENFLGVKYNASTQKMKYIQLKAEQSWLLKPAIASFLDSYNGNL